jgi:hypothetical protein
LLDGEEISNEARRERADSHTGQQISHHRWQVQAASKQTTYESRQQRYRNIEQDRKSMLHLSPPY